MSATLPLTELTNDETSLGNILYSMGVVALEQLKDLGVGRRMGEKLVRAGMIAPNVLELALKFQEDLRSRNRFKKGRAMSEIALHLRSRARITQKPQARRPDISPCECLQLIGANESR